MPYVAEKRKAELNDGACPITVGDLTYLLQSQLNRYLVAKAPVRFADLAECIGALEAAKADFTNRVLIQYEHGKELEHGDVWDPALIERVMGL